MRVQNIARAAAALLLGLTIPAAAVPALPLALTRRAGIPDPADDPFYTPPAHFANTAPGTILRYRPIVASFFSLVPDPVQAWQLLYRTTAVNGSAIATVTTVFKPLGAKLDRFVSYATAYDSSATHCDPSYAYRLGANSTDNSDTSAEFLIVEGYLLQGYIVSSPDYEGPDAAFTPGHLEGMCVLDSMRAVSNFAGNLSLTTHAPAIVGVGYSGGAIATGWAAALQSAYAPELPVKGWAHGGTPANLTGVLLNIDNTTFSGFLPAAVVGLTSPTAYQAQLQPLFSKILTTKGKQAFTYAKTHCMSDDLSQYAFTSLLSYEFQTMGPAVLQNAQLKQVMTDNILGLQTSQTPKVPVLVYHAKQDEIIPYANATSLVNRWCSRGASVTFTTYDKGGHVTTAIVGTPQVYQYVNSLFAGTVAKGCTRNEKLSSALDPVGLAVELEPILVGLANILGNIKNNQ